MEEEWLLAASILKMRECPIEGISKSMSRNDTDDTVEMGIKRKRTRDQTCVKVITRTVGVSDNESVCRQTKCGSPVSMDDCRYCPRHKCGKLNCTNIIVSNGFCVAHGGGKRCYNNDCTKSAIGSTKFCCTHGGGRKCEFKECSKSARATTKFCAAHGGGKRCTLQDCTKSARGSSMLCAAHGGGKRCSHYECTKSAIGSTGLCTSHGGRKKCKMKGCRMQIGRSLSEVCFAHGDEKLNLLPKNEYCDQEILRCEHFNCVEECLPDSSSCVYHSGRRIAKRCKMVKTSRESFGTQHSKQLAGSGMGGRCEAKGCMKSSWGEGYCKSHLPDLLLCFTRASSSSEEFSP